MDYLLPVKCTESSCGYEYLIACRDWELDAMKKTQDNNKTLDCTCPKCSNSKCAFKEKK